MYDWTVPVFASGVFILEGLTPQNPPKNVQRPSHLCISPERLVRLDTCKFGLARYRM